VEKTIVKTKRLFNWALNLIFPPRCVVCGRLEIWLCPSCAQTLSLFDKPCCPQCSRPGATSELCETCRIQPLRVNPVRSAFLFDKEGPIRDLLHALKYYGAGEVLVQALAQPLVAAWERACLTSDVLLPIPLHPQREATRGYNQSVLLAHVLSQHVGIPVVSDALARVRNTPSQTRLKLAQRRDNVKDAFAIKETANFTPAQKHITLIDDVATTGATLDACAAVLLNQGARQVNAFTLARAL